MPCSRDPVEPERITVTHLPPLGVRHAGERILDIAPRPRIGRRDMRIVGLPHDVLDAGQLAQLDARLFVPEVDVNLPPENLARPGRDALAPEPALSPLVVAGFEDVAHPTESRF